MDIISLYNYYPLKAKNYRVHLVVWAEKLEYDKDEGIIVASILRTKFLINSEISDAKHGTIFMSVGSKILFDHTHSKSWIYRKSYKKIPPDIITRCTLF